MIRFSLVLLLVFVAVQCRKAVIAVRGQTVCPNGSPTATVRVELNDHKGKLYEKRLSQIQGPVGGLSATKEARYGIRPYLRITHNCAGFVDRLCLDLGDYTHDMDFTLGQFPLQNGLNVMPEEEYNKDLYRC